MPVKWSPDKDQMLLLKILETHDLHVDAKKISEAWPDGDGEKPTPRAITERLVKIRHNAKASGAAHFGISSSQSKVAKGPRPTTSTPKKTKQTSTDATTPATPPASVKRKRENTIPGLKTEPTSDSGDSGTAFDMLPDFHSAQFGRPSPPASDDNGAMSPSKFRRTDAMEFSNLEDELVI